MQAANGTAVGGRSLPLLHYKDLGLSTQNRKVRFTCVHASDNFLACGYEQIRAFGGDSLGGGG